MTVKTDSTVPGTHTQPALTAGDARPRSPATITNNGGTALRSVQLTLQAPKGWTSSATSATSFASIAPGKTETVTWSRDPVSRRHRGQRAWS